MQLFSTKGFEWNPLQLKVPYLPPMLEGVRIVHLSDIHLRPCWSGAYDELIGQLRDNPPDLIAITGDFVDNKLDHRAALPVLERLLTQLTSRLGIFGITGNHDGDLLGPRLEGMGVRFISNRFVRLATPECSIELVGIGGVKRRDFDPDFLSTIPPRTPGVPRIVLGHYPDQIRFIGSLKADALLVGHTHGGQICTPSCRALITHDALDKRMARGAHRFDNTTLIVNRGFGMTSWPVRMFCPAEVVDIHLTTR